MNIATKVTKNKAKGRLKSMNEDVLNEDLTIEDNTHYLDEFLESSIYNSKYKSHIKEKKLNITTALFIGIILLSFSLIVVAKIINGNIGEIITYIAIVLFFSDLIITSLINIVLHNKLTLYVANTDKLDSYLRSANRTSFKEHNSYCLTGPTLPVKSTDSNEYPNAGKHMLILFILPFIICSLCTYIKYGDNWSLILLLDELALFISIGLLLLYNYCIKFFIKKNLSFYDETVDAVCVEISAHKNHHMNNRGGRSYGAILYAKCKNGHKYILMPNAFTNHIPYVGEMYQINVKSDNPVSYEYKNFNMSSYLPYTIFALFWTVFSLFGYIFLLFNTTLV